MMIINMIFPYGSSSSSTSESKGVSDTAKETERKRERKRWGTPMQKRNMKVRMPTMAITNYG